MSGNESWHLRDCSASTFCAMTLLRLKIKSPQSQPFRPQSDHSESHSALKRPSYRLDTLQRLNRSPASRIARTFETTDRVAVEVRAAYGFIGGPGRLRDKRSRIGVRNVSEGCPSLPLYNQNRSLTRRVTVLLDATFIQNLLWWISPGCCRISRQLQLISRKN